MKYFYDCEFLEDGRTIKLISIGIVAEDGRELYLINRDAPWRRIRKNEWLMANVVPKLPQPHGDWILHMPRRWLCDLMDPDVRRYKDIGPLVRDFILNPWVQQGPIELWADHGAYDHVALCQLFGRMIDLPDGIPMFTNDFQQEWHRLGRPAIPFQSSSLHSAIEDARHLRDCAQTVGLIGVPA